MVTSLGAEVISSKCMAPGCPCKVPHTTWKIAEPKDYERYLYFLTKDFAEKSGQYVFCSNESCGKVIQFFGGYKSADVVECLCGQRFCFACGREKHNPVTCTQFDTWKAKNSGDEESIKLVNATAKPCFHCKMPTERNQGCNHMTCSRCRGEWCWMCRGDWKTHGSHTGGYFSCNKYDTSDAKKIDDQSARVLEDNKKMAFFFERFIGHESSANQLLRNKAKMLADAQAYGQQAHINYDAVGEAINLIVECRVILKYTYVYAFFMPETWKEKNFFEYLQANAEGITERLNKLVQTPVETLNLDELMNLIRVTRKFINNLVKGIEEGLPEVERTPAPAPEPDPATIPDRVKHPLHKHELVRNYADNGWRCDGADRKGGCRRGITGFGQTSGMSRWRCASCDYDLCDKCILDKKSP